VRLPEADPAASPELERAFAEFRRTRGIVSNIMRAYAHAPAGLAALAELGRYCRYDTALSELQKELVILITGGGVAYAWHHHAPLGLRAGLGEAQLDAIRRGEVPEAIGGGRRAGGVRFHRRRAARRAGARVRGDARALHAAADHRREPDRGVLPGDRGDGHRLRG
jgi:hypothetical protein